MHACVCIGSRLWFCVVRNVEDLHRFVALLCRRMSVSEVARLGGNIPAEGGPCRRLRATRCLDFMAGGQSL